VGGCAHAGPSPRAPHCTPGNATPSLYFVTTAARDMWPNTRTCCDSSDTAQPTNGRLPCRNAPPLPHWSPKKAQHTCMEGTWRVAASCPTQARSRCCPQSARRRCSQHMPSPRRARLPELLLHGRQSGTGQHSSSRGGWVVSAHRVTHAASLPAHEGTRGLLQPGAARWHDAPKQRQQR
jgi:hypothetical protein